MFKLEEMLMLEWIKRKFQTKFWQKIIGNNNYQAGRDINIFHEDVPAQIDHAIDLLDKHSVDTALEYLLKLKPRIWNKTSTSDKDKFRILTNIGYAYFKMNKFREANQMFIEAHKLNSEDETAISNCANGYLMIGEKERASFQLQHLLSKHPDSSKTKCLNIVMETKSVEEIEHELSSYDKIDSEILQTLGLKAINEGNVTKSIEYLEKSLNTSSSKERHTIEYQLAIAKLEAISNPFYDVKYISENKIAIEVVEHLNNVIQEIGGTEVENYRYMIYVCRAAAYKKLNEADKARKDLELVLSKEPNNTLAIRLIAELEFESSARESAIDRLKKFLADKFDVELSMKLADFYRIENRFDESEELCLLIKDQPLDEHTRSDLFRILAHIYEAKGETKKIEELTNSIGLPNSKIVISVDKAKQQRQKGNYDKAIEIVNTALQERDELNSIYERKELANICYDLGLYESAESLYEEFVNSQDDSLELRKLINSKQKLNHLDDALSLCKPLIQKYPTEEFYVSTALSIYQELGDTEQFLSHLKNAIESTNSSYFKLVYAENCMSLGKFEEVDRILDSQFNCEELDIYGSFKLSRIFALRQRLPEFYSLMLNTLLANYNNPEVHLLYTTFFFDRGDKDLEFLTRNEVKPDSFVVLQQDSTTDSYILTDSSDVDIAKNEINPDLPIYKKLVGCKLGDKIDFSKTDVTKDEWEVVTIESKYVFYHKKSIEFLSKMSLENNGFSKVKLDPTNSTKEEIEKVLEHFTEGANERGKYTESVFQAYKEKKISIGIISESLNANPIEVWSWLVNSQDTGVFSDTGVKFQSAITYKTDVKIVIDIISLCTLTNLQLSDIITTKFGKLLVIQSTLDTVNSLHEELRSGMKSKGFLTIGKSNNRLFVHEVTAENISRSLTFLENIKMQIEKYCDISPLLPKTIQNCVDYSQKRDAFMKCFWDSALLAQQEDAILYADDIVFRQLAINELGVLSLSTQSLLNELHANTLLSREQYLDSVIKLSDLNYRHTSINAEVLIYKAKQCGWSPDDSFHYIIRILGGTFSDLISALNVSVEFINAFWSEVISDAARNQFLDLTLDNFVKDRNPKNCIHLLEMQLKRKFILLPIELHKILKLIQEWKALKVF
jgi:predicted Zn-dependent protease